MRMIDWICNGILMYKHAFRWNVVMLLDRKVSFVGDKQFALLVLQSGRLEHTYQENLSFPSNWLLSLYCSFKLLFVAAAEIMWFEKLTVWGSIIETNLLLPLVIVSGATTSAAQLAGDFGPL